MYWNFVQSLLVNDFVQSRCWVYVDMFAGSRDPCRWVSAKYAVVKYRWVSARQSWDVVTVTLHYRGGTVVQSILLSLLKMPGTGVGHGVGNAVSGGRADGWD